MMSSWNDAIILLKSVNTATDEEEEVDKGWWERATRQTGTGYTPSGRTGGSDTTITAPPTQRISPPTPAPTSGGGLTRGGGGSSPSLRGIAAASPFKRR